MDDLKSKLYMERQWADGHTTQVYDVGHYNVVVNGYKEAKDSRITVDIRRKTDRFCRYLPHLYIYQHKAEDEDAFLEVRIATGSFWFLSTGETRDLIEALQNANADAKYIQQFFLDPISNGTWNWEE